MEQVYVIGDVHGMYDLFLQALQKFDPQTMQLVLIGDLMDRGPEPKKCFLKAKELVENYGAIYLRGNHEDILWNFLHSPEERMDNYLRNGAKETLESFLHPGVLAEYSPTEIAMLLRSHYPELEPFLAARPYYYEWEDFIFVHAGLNLALADWRETSPHDMIWIRQPFFEGKNRTGKKIVFGHTITPSLYGDNENTDLWLSDNKIGLDGGAVYGGTLHGVLFHPHEIYLDQQWDNVTGPWQPDL
ncbi:metallophosphoesterase family protein [Enterococcus nangangensis]|uniref:metallophosphoesterase family protein n=1 Tax=Enterococcus nangangensis TaxID=2559926 RepID=UPI0010F80C6A|nr:metallophosphoesterase family protein [Enterococcus nangangensis]